MNQIINGAMRIDQRHAGVATAMFTTPRYVLDRFYGRRTGGSATHARVDLLAEGKRPPPGLRNALKCVFVPAAGVNNVIWAQRIEGADTLAGVASVVDFWWWSTVAARARLVVTQHFGTGGSPSADRVVIDRKLRMPAITGDDPQRITVPMTPQPIAGRTFGTDGNDYLEVMLRLDDDEATAHTSLTTGVYVGPGPAPEQFPVTTLADDLAACRRFFEQIANDSGTETYLPTGICFLTTRVNTSLIFTPKRAAPTFTTVGGNWRLNDGSGTKAGTPVAAAIGTSALRLDVTTTGLTVGRACLLWLLDGGTLTLDAEL